MSAEYRLNLAKACCLIGFLFLLATTYWLRSEVLALTRIRLFDAQTNRFVYVASLLLSFVFLIGPSFHSLLSAVMGLLKGPDGY